MILRYFASISLGALMTALLLWTMQYLIYTADGYVEDQPRHRLPPFLPQIEDSPIDVRDHLPPPIPPPQRPPPMTPQNSVENGPITGIPLVPVPPTPTSTTTINPFPAEGALVQIVASQPIYPARALSQGLEGFVDVAFDVDAQGLVQNVIVTKSSHRVFERAAIAAAYRAKFRPRISEGVPVASIGLRKRFRFALDE